MPAAGSALWRTAGPAEGPGAVGDPAQAGAPADPGAADPVVGDLHPQPVAHADDVDLDLRRLRVLHRVRDRLDDHVVDGALHRRREPVVGTRLGGQHHRERAPLREVLDRGEQAPLDEQRGSLRRTWNSGNTEPVPLHFGLMDSPQPLTADNLLFVIDTMTWARDTHSLHGSSAEPPRGPQRHPASSSRRWTAPSMTLPEAPPS